ncbi:MAG: glycyl-radical enzyme activating protein, partial [Syntrophomonadaceae bacterium]|nr:glycyl-radical enzyme activating protein [Syntrophomonadaceae bacterium]
MNNQPSGPSSEISGIVTTIQRYSLDDGPGIRTTVFLKGCQLRCPWCHNPEGINRLPELYFRASKCIGCGQCLEVCPVEGAIDFSDPERIDRQRCTKCMLCTEICPSGSLKQVGSVMSVSEVMNEVVKDRLFYEASGGGVTFSGGEATFQVEFLIALLEHSKACGIHTCLESNGLAGKTVWERIVPNLDLLY